MTDTPSGGGPSGDLAHRLVEAHRDGRRLPAPQAGDAPPDFAASYAIQALVAARVGGPVAGWKAALSPQGPVVAPIFASSVSAGGAPRPAGGPPVFGVELECAFRLGSAPGAGGASRSAPEPAPPIMEVRLGVELIGSRFVDPGAAPFTAFLADNLANAGYCFGETIDPQGLPSLENAVCRVEIDGRLVFEGAPRHPNGDPRAPLGPCLPVLAAHPAGYAAGQFVTTGSLCGVLAVERPRRIDAVIDGVGRVQCLFD